MNLVLAAALGVSAGFCAPAASPARPGVFTFRSYGMEDGLGNLAVLAVAQDTEGFLWVGTEDSIYRYDGKRFMNRAKGLKTTSIWDIATGPRGAVCVSTDDGLFSLQGDAFVPFEGLPGQRAEFVALGPGDSAVASVGNQVFSRRGPGAMKVVHVLPAQVTGGWASQDLNTVYAVTETQVWRCAGGTWSAVDLPRNLHGIGCRVFQDSAGRLFLRTRAGLWRRDQWGGTWVDLSGRLPGNAFNPFPPVEDALGRIWVGTSKGLVCWEGEKTWVLGEAKGLPEGWAGPLLLDHEGSLWAGNEGLQKLQGRFLWTHFGTHQGLPSPTVWTVRAVPDGRVFVATDNGAAVLKGETWATVPGSEGRTLLAAELDRDALWFGGIARTEDSNVLLRLDLKTNRLEKVPIKPCRTTDLVFAICAASQDGIYIGTRVGGVFRLTRDPSGWRTESVPFPERPAGDRVNDLKLDSEGLLWAATEHGLQVLEKGRWTRLGSGEGLAGANCAGLARDPQGRVWATFLDAKGLYRLGREQGAWKVAQALVQPEHLFDSAISSMAFDPNGVLWLGTGTGMKRWDGKNLELFDRGSGLVSMDPSANSIEAEPDGGVWQSFSNGISHFDPSMYRGTPPPPGARVIEVRDGKGGLALQAGPAQIPFKDGTLTFDFSALPFLDEGRIIYQVRLVGLENDWRETRIAEARYPGLQAGAYRFEVRARYREGALGPVAPFAFRVLPPWWQTWWARGLLGLAAAAGLAGLFRWRVRLLQDRAEALERQTRLLEKEVQKRTANLEDANARIASLAENAKMALLDLPAWAAGVAEELAKVLGLSGIDIWICENGEPHPLAGASGTRPDLLEAMAHADLNGFHRVDADTVVVPACGVGGATDGFLVAHGSESSWSTTTRRLLSTFAVHLAGAVDLQRMRIEIAMATEGRHLQRQEVLDRGGSLLHLCPVCGACYDHRTEHCEQDGALLESPRAIPYQIGGRYTLQKLLGRGAAGMVFASMDHKLGRSVAIKIVLPETFTDIQAVLRFEQEAKALARVNHPGVIGIFDSGELAEGSRFIVMERLQGTTLRNLLDTQGPASAEQAAELLIQIGSALGAAHSAGLIHRDIKPENLFLSGGPRSFQVKVLDFGLARSMQVDSHLTQSGFLVGTPLYMSPEQLLGQRVDARSDLYSLGVVIYEVLTGARMIQRSTFAEIYVEIVQKQTPNIRDRRPNLPELVNLVFQSALAKDPNGRPSDILAWATALSALLRTAPVDRSEWRWAFDGTEVSILAAETETLLPP